MINNLKTTTKIKRERESKYASNCSVEFVIPKRLDWAMKSRTALNINEFILFDIIHFTHLHSTNDCTVPASFIVASVTLLRRRLLFDCQLNNRIK